MIDEDACSKWLSAYETWRKRDDRKMHELPAKPPGFDLWLQGDNPLRLKTTDAMITRLVPQHWSTTAKPIPLPNTPYTQADLPL